MPCRECAQPAWPWRDSSFALIADTGGCSDRGALNRMRMP